jgi:hypothetical protein
MLDANGTLEDDTDLHDMIQTCGLHDLHRHDPPKSTYIGTESRRIDFMFGCIKIVEAVVKSGTLSYTEGPQSDHRSMYIDLTTKVLLEHHPRITPSNLQNAGRSRQATQKSLLSTTSTC